MRPRVGSMVCWSFSSGNATGKILKIVATGKVTIPNSSVTMTGTAREPVALIRVYKNGVASKEIVGHKLSTLRRLEDK